MVEPTSVETHLNRASNAPRHFPACKSPESYLEWIFWGGLCIFGMNLGCLLTGLGPSGGGDFVSLE